MRVRERTVVSDKFVDAMVAIAKQYLKRTDGWLKSYSGARREEWMKNNSVQVVRMSAIAQRVEEVGKGLDYELTRLRGSQYKKLGMHEHKDNMYVVGETRDLTMTASSSRRDWNGTGGFPKGAQWDIGSYLICVPLEAFRKQQITGIHFIPQRSRLSPSRLPHHAAHTRDVSHPLDARASTCWAQFSGPVSKCVKSGGMVELMLYLVTFAKRYNPNSPLVGIQPWMEAKF